MRALDIENSISSIRMSPSRIYREYVFKLDETARLFSVFKCD